MAETFRHSNGAGVIIGIDGSVSPDSHVDRKSTIAGRSFLSQCQITNSLIQDSSLTLAEIDNAAIRRSHISQAFIGTSVLDRVVVRSAHGRNADLENCELSNQVVVEGAKLRGVSLDGPFLVHSNWEHTPRHAYLSANGISLGIIECVDGKSHVGCICRPVAEWVQKKELLRRIFQKRGWQGEEVDLIHDLFKSWAT